MLKFTGDGKNGKVFFIGLTRANIDQLTSSRPIPLNLADMGGPNIDICILFGETERMLFNSLKAGGLIPAGVEYREAHPGVAEITRITREVDEKEQG